MALFRFRMLLRSFRFAGRGIRYAFRHEQSFRIQSIVALLIIAFIFLFRVTKQETIVLIVLTASVLVLEILNTALEMFLDVIKPRMHYAVEVIKDLMAAAVLLVSLVAVIIGLYIFVPYIAHSLDRASLMVGQLTL